MPRSPGKTLLLSTLDSPVAGRAAAPPGARLANLYAPLAAAALLSALAGPVLNHQLARAAQPAPALAGFWVGYSVLLLLEAACFVWQPTALAFLGAPRARGRLVLLALATGAATSALVWGAGQPATARWLFRTLVPTTPAAAEVAAGVLRTLAPLPAMVALRGVLAAAVLRDGRGFAIPAGLVLRLLLLALWPALFPAAPGARLSAEALLAASGCELLVLILARGASGVRGEPCAPPAASRVAAVAAPLVVSTLAWASLRPLLHAVLGHLAAPDVAQARFGLVFAVFMTLCAPVWALRDLAVVCEGSGVPRARVRAFAVRVAAALTAAFACVWLAAWLAPAARAPLGFPAATGPFPVAALAVIALAPLLVAARMPAQGALIARHRTAVFALVPGVRWVATALAGAVLARTLPRADGALLGAALLLAGEVLEAWAYGRAAATEDVRPGTPGAPVSPGTTADALARVA